MPVNMDDFKLNFATLMATLECSKEEKTADTEIDEVQAKESPQAKMTRTRPFISFVRQNLEEE